MHYKLNVNPPLLKQVSAFCVTITLCTKNKHHIYWAVTHKQKISLPKGQTTWKGIDPHGKTLKY